MGDLKKLPSPKVLVKEARCLELFLAKVSLDDIAKLVGYSGRSGAWKSVQRALERVVAENVSEIRAAEIARCDLAMKAIMKGVIEGNHKSINSMIKIQTQLGRYVAGLEEPLTVNHEGASFSVQMVMPALKEAEIVDEDNLAKTADEINASKLPRKL